MIGQVLQFRDLQEICQPGGRPRRATVEAWARKRGLRFNYDAKGGIWTTMDALNAALDLSGRPANDVTALDPSQVL